MVAGWLMASGEDGTVVSQLEVQWGVHPIIMWQFLRSVAAGTSWTTSEDGFGSHSLPMHLKQDRLTRLESQENRFSSFCFAFLLLFCLFSCCCCCRCCPCVVNNCAVVALLSNTVQEVPWKPFYLQAKSNMLKSWKCPEFSGFIEDGQIMEGEQWRKQWPEF